jgi:23S rRNA pseudouridine2605 synthase
MSKQNFDKFINVKIKGAKKKEKIKQEKKSVKKEREAYFIEKKREMRAAKKLQIEAQSSNQHAGGNKNKSAESSGKRGKNATKYASKTGKSFNKPDGFTPEKQLEPAKPQNRPNAKTNKAAIEKTADSKPKKSFTVQQEKSARPFKSKNIETAEPPKPIQRPAYVNANKPAKKTFEGGLPYERKPITKAVVIPDPSKKKPLIKAKVEQPISPIEQSPKRENKPFVSKSEKASPEIPAMPLNKFIAHGGICSRRDAGELVKSGKVKVNGKVITDPGVKIQEGDEVVANGKKVTTQHNLVYILLNKPKDFITTVDDPQGRKTVLDIVKTATNERIYPVGRLDRNTSGVLLLTNDGELAQHLTHPSFEVRKIYEAKLDKPLTKADFEKLLDGIELEDGKVHADSVAYADSKDKSIIGIEIHSGRNRVVRRMFEHLGYDVKGLDRVLFANLTKKNVERGKWRFLNDKEVRLLKFFNKSKQ